MTLFDLGHINVVKILIENNADVNNKIEGNETPLFMAAGRGLYSKKFIENCQQNL